MTKKEQMDMNRRQFLKRLVQQKYNSSYSNEVITAVVAIGIGITTCSLSDAYDKLRSRTCHLALALLTSCAHVVDKLRSRSCNLI